MADIIVTSVTFHSEEVVELVYSQASWITPTAQKFVMLRFDRDVIADVDLQQLDDALAQMADDVEVAIRNPKPVERPE